MPIRSMASMNSISNNSQRGQDLVNTYCGIHTIPPLVEIAREHYLLIRKARFMRFLLKLVR